MDDMPIWMKLLIWIICGQHCSLDDSSVDS